MIVTYSNVCLPILYTVNIYFHSVPILLQRILYQDADKHN